MAAEVPLNVVGADAVLTYGDLTPIVVEAIGVRRVPEGHEYHDDLDLEQTTIAERHASWVIEFCR